MDPAVARLLTESVNPRAVIAAALAEKRLEYFYRQAWSKVLEPSTPFLSNWHIGLIAEHLEAVTSGQIQRLLVNIPPRYGKSLLLSVAWPVWEWIRSPQSRWIFTSYRADLATKHNTDRRLVIESPWYQQLWGAAYRLASDNNQKTYFANDKRGQMLACSILAPPTGQGCTRLIVDDPHDPLRAESKDIRNEQIKSFSGSLYTRLNDKEHDAIVVVMQRLHALDLSAHVLANGDRPYVHVCLEAEAEERKTITFPLSGRVVTREKGDLLWPEREGPTVIAQTKKSLGSYGYAGQFQQRPAPAGGGMFKRAWYRFWRHDPEDPAYYRLDTRSTVSAEDQNDPAIAAWMASGEKFARVAKGECQRFATLDVAGTDSAESDYSVLQIWDMTPGYDILILHQWRDQKQLPDVVKAVASICREWQVEFLAVEKNGVGLGVYQTLCRSGLSVRGLNATMDKTMRARPAVIRMEAGQIFFPADETSWLTGLCEEIEEFPASATKDQSDALAWAAHLVHHLSGGATNASEADEVAQERQRQQIEEAGRENEVDKAQREWEEKQRAYHEKMQGGDEEWEY